MTPQNFSRPPEDAGETPLALQMRERIRAEYLEMSGMRLSAEQVQRLCGVDAAVCKLVMDSLVATRFLCFNADRTYARLTEDSAHPRQTEAKRSVPPLLSSRRASRRSKTNNPD